MSWALGQAVAGRWQDVASKALASAEAQAWADAAREVDRLRLDAQAQDVTPLVLRAQESMKAVQAALGTADASKVADALQALRALHGMARREDLATVDDRIRAEELLDRRLDRFQQTLRDWKTENSGFKALLARLRGGPDVSPLKAEIAAIRGGAEATPLTAEGRQRILERLGQVSPEVEQVGGDWKLLVVGGLGLLVWKGVSSGATAAASAGAAWAAAKAKERYAAARPRKKSGTKKAGTVKKKRKKKRTSE